MEKGKTRKMEFSKIWKMERKTKSKNVTYMFDQSILKFLPALLAMCRVLIENFQAHQTAAIKTAQSFKVDEFLAEEKFQKFPEKIQN